MPEYKIWIKLELDGDETISAYNEHEAQVEVTKKIKQNGWELVNNDGLVMEIERVYATRWDCNIVPERVRRAT